MSEGSDSYAAAGGIIGYGSWYGSFATENCYNRGTVSSSSSLSYAFAGGVAGYLVGTISGTKEGRMLFADCYSTGMMEGTSSKASYTGGIIGYATVKGEGSALVNCYFLGDNMWKNGSKADDRVCGYMEPMIVIDGGARSGIGTGAKNIGEMTPSLSEAKKGNSIYKTGETETDSGPVSGWDFFSVWKMENETGLPILRASGDVDDEEDEDTDPEDPGEGTDPEDPEEGTDPEDPGEGTDPDTNPGAGSGAGWTLSILLIVAITMLAIITAGHVFFVTNGRDEEDKKK
jgi:hypothetical protein